LPSSELFSVSLQQLYLIAKVYKIAILPQMPFVAKKAIRGKMAKKAVLPFLPFWPFLPQGIILLIN